jgi:GT2 family glycosyltransferase
MRVAITITTHNRREELERTLGVLAQLNPPPDAIYVCADGCTDGTLEYLTREHPGIQVIVHEVAQGSVPSRNELAATAQCDVFVSLDDDSYPLDLDFVERVRKIFESQPRLAVASFAQRSNEFPESLTTTDFGQPSFIGSFANCGAAVRRHAFLELGGYPGFFFHAYEEPDLALRCVASGWQVRYEPTLVVRHHFTMTKRNEIRMHHRHARNECWSALMRCPLPQLPFVLGYRLIRQFGYAWKRGFPWVIREPAWWRQAASGIGQCLAARNPIPWHRYGAWMRLVRSPIHSEVEWNALFGERPA